MAKEDETSLGFYDKLKGLGFTTEGEEIKWNFTKFLVDREGNVVKRFAPQKKPVQIEREIEKLL